MNEQRKADVQTLKGLASFFEGLATGKEPYPLMASQAINRAIESLEMEIQMDEDFSGEADPSTEALVDGSWQRFKTMTGDWECKDFADGWITFPNLSEAIDYQLKTGCIMRPKPE